MESSFELPPHAPLKSKLCQVKSLLDKANQRLQEEKSKCEIFTTKTSASGSGGNASVNAASSNIQHHNGNQNMQTDLLTTMSDISTLKSVLSCPIFNRIVNVTDSLDKLSYQLNLHPSIGPSDININANGELILAPPIEPTSLNNLINSQLDDYSDHINNSPQIVGQILVQQNQNNPIMITEQQIPSNHQQGGINNPALCQSSNGENLFSIQSGQTNSQQFSHLVQNRTDANSYMPWLNARSNFYDNEKLVSNGVNKVLVNANKQFNHQDSKMHAQVDSGQAAYNPNGQPVTIHPCLDSVTQRNHNLKGTQSPMNQACETIQDTTSNGNGYSNEMYNTTQELNQPGYRMVHTQQAQFNGRNSNAYTKNNSNYIVGTDGKVQTHNNCAGIQYNHRSCSPSTSAGSTVRLADADCDSGASSYQSQNAKGTPYSAYPYKSHDQIMDSQVTTMPETREDCVDSMEQDLNDNLYPEMEKIQVTLEKENNSLGITIAGYICEKEEISGIFIKSITPNSPADRSGKIRALDQIFAVNGRELLGYNNQEAVNVLKHAGKVVNLELMRHLADAKYRKLETALAHAIPTTNTNSKLDSAEDVLSKNISASSFHDTPDCQMRSSIPVSVLRENYSPVKQQGSVTHKPPSARASNGQQSINSQMDGSFRKESMDGDQDISNKVPALKYFNQSKENLPSSPEAQSQIPVAAQRGGTNKVIETKQGARNTIDIRSPACQTPTTYVNKIVSRMESCEAIQDSNAHFQRNSSDEFDVLIRDNEPEWEKTAKIIELQKGMSQGLGFTVKEYANPKDQNKSIIMITSLTPGGIAERDGRLSFGDLLIFVDDTNLEGGSLQETVKALKKTTGQVRLGVLKLKRD